MGVLAVLPRWLLLVAVILPCQVSADRYFKPGKKLERNPCLGMSIPERAGLRGVAKAAQELSASRTKDGLSYGDRLAFINFSRMVRGLRAENRRLSSLPFETMIGRACLAYPLIPQLREFLDRLDQGQPISGAVLRSWFDAMRQRARARGLDYMWLALEFVSGKRSFIDKGQPVVSGVTAPSEIKERFDALYARKVTRHFSDPRNWVLPIGLPALPATDDPRLLALLAQVLERARGARNQNAVRYALLEQVAAHVEAGPLRSLPVAITPADRQHLRRLLPPYLAAYRERIAPRVERWLEQRLERYAPGPDAATGAPTVRFDRPDLADRRGDWRRTGADSHPYVDPGTQQEVRDVVAQAWTIIRRAVDPKVLAALPGFEVAFDHHRRRADYVHHDLDYRSAIARVGPGVTVDTILHEFGHHLERHGGLRAYAAAVAFVARRTRGKPVHLSVLDANREWNDNEVAFRGADRGEVYKLKFYDDSSKYDCDVRWDRSTEVPSLGLGALESTASAMKLFRQDPEHLFLTLSALQNTPVFPGDARRRVPRRVSIRPTASNAGPLSAAPGGE